MRRLTAAVFGTIGLLVAAASAWSVENSTWSTSGTIWLDVRTAGLPRFSAEGPFEGASTGVFSNQIVVNHGEVSFSSNATATSTDVFPGSPAFEPVRFTETTAKFKVDFDDPPGSIDFPAIIEEYTDNLISEIVVVPVTFTDASTTTLTSAEFQGIEIFRPTLKAGGQLRAFNGFSEIKGGFTISGKGLTFISGDSKTKGRKTTFKIRNVMRGVRNT